MKNGGLSSPASACDDARLSIQSLTGKRRQCRRAIQNDPSNGNRALPLAQKYGVIRLKAGVGANGVNAVPLDVAGNLKKIKRVESTPSRTAIGRG